MVKELEINGMTKYAKISFIAEKGNFQFFFCPRKLFTRMFIPPTFSTSIGFMMAHFEAKKHEKTIESRKRSAASSEVFAVSS